ncbi:hypothetical protein MRB53_026559 [Persea americana]|uniref:Uncharacterized protein n=1 Tax=Persea americana TaxID=3435 RepID=A0ACC2LJB7_PERAE|nr:hypothetical protein MRB53_026559 [Persea americana]
MAPITLVKVALMMVIITTSTVDSFNVRSVRTKEKETKMVFYMQDWESGGLDRRSKQIGRAQGIYVNSALDASDLHLLFSIVFTNEKYNGSTIEIQGADRFFLKQREVSVVSRTGCIRFAKGFAVLETVYLDLANLNAVIRFNVTIHHY